MAMQTAEVLRKGIIEMSWGPHVIFVVRKVMNCTVLSILFASPTNAGLGKFSANVSGSFFPEDCFQVLCF